MLAEFDGAVPIDDPHLGHHLGVWRPIPLAWAAADGEPPKLRTLLDLKADEPGYFFAERHRDSWWEPLRALIEARFEAAAPGTRGPGRRPTYVVKEPGSQAAPLLTELFPRSKLVFLLRDGRDVVDSWLDGYRDGAWAIPGGAFPVTEEGRIPLIRWLSAVWAFRTRAVAAAFDARPPEDRVLVRYEILRERTSETLAAICEMLGFDRRRAGEVVKRHRFEALPQGARGPGRRERAARPGSWRENLSAPERQAMYEELGETLASFGYEPDLLAAVGTAP
jgi:Sulfotransferase family